jgi:resuscitation-promoting factor RpfA
MVNEGLTAMAGQGRFVVTAIAGLVALGVMATRAEAQWFPPGGFGGPVVYYQPQPLYPPAGIYQRGAPIPGLHPVEVASILSRRHGFTDISRPVRQGPVFVANAIDGGGQRLRVIIDAYTGALLDGQLLGPPPRVAQRSQTRTRVAVAPPDAPTRAKIITRDVTREAAPRRPAVAAVKPIAPKAVSPVAPHTPASQTSAPTQSEPSTTASYPPALAPALATPGAAKPELVKPELVKPVAPAAQTAPSTVKAETKPTPATNAQGQPVRMIPIAPLEETRRTPTGPSAPAVPPAPLN